MPRVAVRYEGYSSSYNEWLPFTARFIRPRSSTEQLRLERKRPRPEDHLQGGDDHSSHVTHASSTISSPSRRPRTVSLGANASEIDTTLTPGSNESPKKYGRVNTLDTNISPSGVMKPVTRSATASSSIPAQQIALPSTNGSSTIHRCLACNKTFSALQYLKQHQAGPTHLRRLEELVLAGVAIPFESKDNQPVAASSTHTSSADLDGDVSRLSPTVANSPGSSTEVSGNAWSTSSWDFFFHAFLSFVSPILLIYSFL